MFVGNQQDICGSMWFDSGDIGLNQLGLTNKNNGYPLVIC